ncbi:hypothetical protein WJX84_003748 [Apatococcus fuscideae]|uniref:Thrombospondin type 1 domain-containing protein n=1 Tax=Apatococcus fuscideae TaxID=2026836 RepID=A0AAW1RSS3_9CHLO
MSAYLCGCCDLVAADTYAAAVNGTCKAGCTAQSGGSLPCASGTGSAPALAPSTVDAALPSGPGRSMRSSSSVLFAQSVSEAPAPSTGGDGNDYKLETGPWSRCDAGTGCVGTEQASGEEAMRPLYCIAQNNGLPVPSAKCSYNISDLPDLSRPCGTGPACSTGYYWQTGTWSACSASCGANGLSTRTATCKGPEGNEIVDDSQEYQGCLLADAMPSFALVYSSACLTEAGGLSNGSSISLVSMVEMVQVYSVRQLYEEPAHAG